MVGGRPSDPGDGGPPPRKRAGPRALSRRHGIVEARGPEHRAARPPLHRARARSSGVRRLGARPARDDRRRVPRSRARAVRRDVSRRWTAEAGRVLVRRRHRHEPGPAVIAPGDTPVPDLARRLPHAALRRPADGELQGGGRRREAIPRGLPPQPARQHAERSRERERGDRGHPGRERPPHPLQQPQGERWGNAAGRPRRALLPDAAALGRARRLSVPARPALDRRDSRRRRHARPAPDSPRRPLVGVRERARGQSPDAGVLFGLSVGPVLRLPEAADEVRQPRVPEHRSYGLRLAEMEPVVIGRAVELRARRLLRGLASPAPHEHRAGEAVEIRIGGPGDGPPPCPRLVERRHGERLAVTELLHLGHHGLTLGAPEPVELLLPCEVADHPRGRVYPAQPPGGFLGGDGLEPAEPFTPGEPELCHQRMDHRPSSVFFMTAAAWSIIARISPASSLGNRSAIQTSRQRRGPSAKTCTDALWCVSRPPRADQASRRASSSTWTISSRTTMPLPNVTTRAPSSRRVSTTNPGTRRWCSAPTARTAAQTFSALLSSRISLRMLAMMTSSLRRSS